MGVEVTDSLAHIGGGRGGFWKTAVMSGTRLGLG